MIRPLLALGALGLLVVSGKPGEPREDFLLPKPEQEAAPPSIAAWGDSIPLGPSVEGEILRFGGGTPLSPGYARAFARDVRDRVMSEAGARVAELLAGDCTPFVDVTIGEWDVPDPPDEPLSREVKKLAESFEGSLIRTEMVACLHGFDGDPKEVLELYTNREFRMAAADRILDIWDDSEGSCIETKGAYRLVDPTKVCNEITELRAPDLAAQHSQVVFNQAADPYQTIYFKESLKTFVRLSDGIGLHYINYTRAGNLNRMARWIGAGQIRKTEEGMVDLLRTRLTEGMSR